MGWLLQWVILFHVIILLFFSLVQSIIFLLCILLSIAYFTLFERKILSYSQSRVGPNKTGGFGLLQPVFDGVKLMGKERFVTAQSGLILFFVAPLSLFPFILESWVLPTDFYTLNESTYLVLFLLGLLALSVLGLLLSGIISASKFGYLGGMRASSQRVRYEISLSLVLFSLQALSESFQWSSFTIAMFLFPLWFISIVAEVSRAPLDFREGESELISGFNVEFGSSLFILIFLREYGIVLSFSFLTSVLFFGGRVILAGILSLSILLLRASFPRFRYDYLIGLCWLVILPLSIIILCIVFIVKDYGVLSSLGG